MKRFLSLLLPLWLLSGPLSAEQVENLYEAEVRVSDQSPEARQEALRSALEVVLVKVSGVGAVAREPGIASAFTLPDRFVQQFRYRAESGHTGLWVRFEAAAIDQLLRGRGFSVWGGVRPATLVWMAVQQGGERQLIGGNEQGLFQQTLLNHAERRGLPLRLPLLDPTDRSRLRPADLWGEFREPIAAASARYQVQAVLSGSLLEEATQRWHARWVLSLDGHLRRWEARGTLDEVMASGIDGTADDLVRLYRSGESEAGGTVRVRVADVGTLEQYVRVMDYLRGLSGVTAVQPVEVESEQVVYAVVLQGSAGAFEQAISLGELLVREAKRPADPTELVYRLLQ